MPRLTIGTTPLQVLRPNSQRATLDIVFVPSSIIAGNTGLIYGKVHTPPRASATADTWDFVINSGSSYSLKLLQGDPAHLVKSEIWLVSDTAGQIVTVTETNEA